MPRNHSPEDLIVNGGFERGRSGWSGNDLETNHKESAYLRNGSSNRVAELDGRSNNTTVMEQSFDVPGPLSTDLSLDAALRNASLGQAGEEGFTVEILDADGNAIASAEILPTENSFQSFSVPVDFPAAGRFTLRMTELGPDNSLGAIIDNVSMLVCFTGGTRLRTPSGNILARYIRAGDIVTTLRGPKPVRWVARRHVSAQELAQSRTMRPVLIRAGALGVGLPRVDLRVSRQHRMLVRSPVAARMFGTPEVLVAAIRLLELPGVEMDDSMAPVDYMHILFDAHEIVIAEGAPSESFLVGREALTALTPSARSELAEILSGGSGEAGTPNPAAPIPEPRRQRKLVQRLVQNGLSPLDDFRLTPAFVAPAVAVARPVPDTGGPVSPVTGAASMTTNDGMTAPP